MFPSSFPFFPSFIVPFISPTLPPFIIVPLSDLLFPLIPPTFLNLFSVRANVRCHNSSWMANWSVRFLQLRSFEIPNYLSAAHDFISVHRKQYFMSLSLRSMNQQKEDYSSRSNTMMPSHLSILECAVCFSMCSHFRGILSVERTFIRHAPSISSNLPLNSVSQPLNLHEFFIPSSSPFSRWMDHDRIWDEKDIVVDGLSY